MARITNEQLAEKLNLILAKLETSTEVEAPPSDDAVFIVEPQAVDEVKPSKVLVELLGDWETHKQGEEIEIDEALANAFENCHPQMVKRI